jgi:hypothetical protein
MKKQSSFRRFRPNLEILEDRTVRNYSIGLGAGTFRVTDTFAPMTWTAPDLTGNVVPGGDVLKAWLNTTITFTDTEKVWSGFLPGKPTPSISIGLRQAPLAMPR